eukprot:5166333-Pleurochrysis_carterae.AAC.1
MACTRHARRTHSAATRATHRTLQLESPWVIFEEARSPLSNPASHSASLFFCEGACHEYLLRMSCALSRPFACRDLRLIILISPH